MFRKLRYSLIMQMYSNRELLKAVAFSLFTRKRMGMKNVIRNFTINKIVEATGIHAKTVKKRIQTLLEYDLARMNGNSFEFLSLVSKHVKRNVRLAHIAYKTAKEVELSLQAILIAVTQLKKNFAMRTIRKAHDGRTKKEVRAAMKASRKYGYGNNPVEAGQSYNGIAFRLHTSISLAQKIVKFGVMRGIFKKIKVFSRYFMPNVGKMKVDWCTFTTKNYGYLIFANNYVVSPSISVFGGGTIR